MADTPLAPDSWSPAPPPRRGLLVAALALFFVDGLIVVGGVDARDPDPYTVALTLVAATQLGLAIAALVSAARGTRRGIPGAWAIALSSLAGVGSCGVWLVGVVLMNLRFDFSGIGGLSGLGGGAWGRPLRIRGRQRHPSLTAGADWTHGPRPDPTGLDVPTRRALEALWLHDAQKEHASVPAFARVSWLLAAVGAPAELLVWAHRAGIEEIAHTQACFALAAGYGGRSFTVEPMPELLLGGLDGAADPRVTLAAESLADGCQLEDFNADVAAACAVACTEPVTRAVLEQIAREERTHADLSWAIVAWLVERHRAVVEPALARAAAGLATYPRPTAVAADKRALVAAASEPALRAHGRLPDARWAACWDARLVATQARLAALLAPTAARAAA